MKTKIVYLLLALVIALPAGAQKLYNDALSLSDVSLWQQGNSLYIDMKIDMSNLAVSPQRSLTLTPLLTDGQHNVALENIIINGRRRQKAYIRGIAIKQELPAGIVIPYEKRGVLDYTQVIPYEPWMENASLNLVENLCGCGNNEEMIAQELISNDVSTEAKRLAAMAPIVAYIQPAVEVVKERSEQYEAHLDFPVNKAVILPEFMNNHKELTNIQTMFDKIQNDKNLTVTGISIEGFASPEGPLKLNEKLSQNRAEALKKYLTTNEKIPANLYKVSFGGENWEGLRKALANLDVTYKTAVESIIDNYDGQERKERLMKLQGGVPYRYLLRNVYPGLRVAICKVEYHVKNFNVEEAKEIIKVRPQNLSLNEMYLVANTYPNGSREFINVFETAVRLFPEDDVAKLNAAIAALSRGDTETAGQFLAQVKHQELPEYANAAGVLALLKGDYDAAERFLQAASDAGLEVAGKNLEELGKKKANDQEMKSRVIYK